MSTTQQPTATGRFERADEMAYAEDPRSGWVTFAAIMLGMLAVLNLIYGIAAIGDSSFFVGDAKFVLAGLNTWGWVLTLVGIAQGLTAIGVFMRWTGVRWLGVAFATINAVVQMLVMPAYPFWSMCFIALDVLVIYGLVVYGAKNV
jgi:hypothetical protein